jgi:hypothetical protein
MNKKKVILWAITLLIGLILTGCGGYYGGYGYREDPSYNCPGDYGLHYCAR